MSVDAAEIGEDEGFGYYGCIFGGYAISFENALGEGESRVLGDVEFWRQVM